MASLNLSNIIININNAIMMVNLTNFGINIKVDLKYYFIYCDQKTILDSINNSNDQRKFNVYQKEIDIFYNLYLIKSGALKITK